jgi:putative spermidine/putrescine transport system permease protein
MIVGSGRLRSPWLGRLILSAVGILVLAFLLVPIFLVMPISFSAGSFLSYPIPGLSLRWYREILEPDPWMLALRNSLYAAVASSLIATVIGTSAAIGLSRTHFRGKTLITSVLVLPLAMPVVITALGVYFWLAEIGLLYTFTGLIVAHTVLGAPYVVITVTSTLQGFDWSLFRAASSLGANNWVAVRTVVLPLIAPGIISGAVFAFIASFDDVVVALFITGPRQFTFPRQLFSGLRDHLDPSIIAAATFLTTLVIALLAVTEWVRQRSERRRGPRAIATIMGETGG